MKDFFPCVPRSDVVGFIRSNVNDNDFSDLFQQALETELGNSDELGSLQRPKDKSDYVIEIKADGANELTPDVFNK